MILASRLSLTTLGDLLGQCHREGATGALLLVEPQGRTHRIYLSRGLITAVELDRASAPLAEVLRELEVPLDETTLRRSLLRSLSSARLHGEVLVQDFAVSPSVVNLALRQQIQMRLSALENLREASVRFTVTEPVPRHALCSEPLQRAEFLHGKKRARDSQAGDSWRAAPRSAPRASYASEREARRVLGVDDAASELEVKRAYRRLVRELHPDLNRDATAEQRRHLESRFANATAAYRALTG